MSASFVFLELLSPEINAFLTELRRVVTGVVRGNRPFHITLRGPYEAEVPPQVLAECRNALSHEVFRIHGVGRFSNKSEEVVYLRIDGPNLRQIWWKPDFPMTIYGFEPHISVYRGNNPVLAKQLEEFLSAEKLDFLCAEHRVTIYRAGQFSFMASAPHSRNTFDALIESGRIRPDVFTRLSEAIGREEDASR